jgi:hypothetical protein
MSAWIGVASADHVARGKSGGFMQVCHGKVAPLKRIHAGDHVFYYSPTQTFGGKERVQAFTAAGIAREGEPYRFDMGDGFIPHRRNVDWFPTRDAPIRPLLDRLEFTRGQASWGQAFRYGLVRISEADAAAILKAMEPVA